MSSLRPVQLYSLQVPCGNVMIEATEVPCTFRITMAALDPTAPAQLDEDGHEVPPRSTLKLIREPADLDLDSEDESDDDDVDAIERRLGRGAEDEEDESSSDDEEFNGGPSDPGKSKAARKAAAVQQLIESLNKDEDVPMTNGVKSDKGKQKASDDDMEDDYDDSDDESLELEETVICTIDPAKTFQQPLDITINENERIYFKVIGSHDIFLTGNYLYDEAEDQDYSEDDEDEMDYNPYLDGLEEEDESDEESDELDDLEDPRIKELESDEEEAPKLIKAADKKNNKKRAAESEDEEPAEPQLNGEKLSKKQQKKLKNNAGQAVAAAEQSKKEIKTEKSDKKVQFAKNLEQGPTGSPKPQGAKVKEEKSDDKKETKKPALGVKVVNGVTIDDKKLGSGPAAKKGNRIGMRYIGKLAKDNKVFDSNKKGKPFSFKLGSGEVIKGWDIGIQGMQVGGERRISIPANLAYGSKGLPGIPANSDLVFDVKMLELH